MAPAEECVPPHHKTAWREGPAVSQAQPQISTEGVDGSRQA